MEVTIDSDAAYVGDRFVLVSSLSSLLLSSLELSDTKVYELSILALPGTS